MSPRWKTSRDAYRLHLAALGRRPGTLNIHNSALRCWERYCAGQRLNPLHPRTVDIEGWLASLYGLYSQSTVRHYLLAVRAFFAWQGDAAAFAGIPVPKERPVPIRPFCHADLRRLLRAADTPCHRAILLLLIGSGIRAAELVGITLEDVETSSGTILVHGKGDKSRIVAPGLAAMQALHEHVRSSRICSGRLFPILPSSLYHLTVRLGERAGVARAMPRRFRNTFGNEFLLNGGGAEDLRVIFGHAKLDMTLRYVAYYEAERALDAQRRFNPADRLMRVI